jgi:protein phosphatase
VNWEETIVEAALTDTGMRRSNNQDSYAIVRATKPEIWRKRGHVYMVADGMGAHAVGEMASKLACDNIPHAYNKLKGDSPREAIIQAYREVGGIIHGKATANQDFQGMGTTCSTLLLLPAGAMIAHVGDSRVYRIRRGRIEQLTFDHSLVWELVRHKHLSIEQASKSVPRNVITRSLGPEPAVEVDIEGPYPTETGDVFVLCSDGLSGLVEDPEIGAFASNFHPEDASRYLTHLANLRGGLDNVTTMVLRIGPWTDPGTTADGSGATGAEQSAGGRGGRGSWLSGLKLPFGRKATKTEEEVEEHLYREADCPIDVQLLQQLSEDVRSAQALAVDQAWNLEWSVLANFRRESEEARAEGDLRGALRCLGEAISMLGQAGRVHRKEHSSTGVH